MAQDQQQLPEEFSLQIPPDTPRSNQSTTAGQTIPEEFTLRVPTQEESISPIEDIARSAASGAARGLTDIVGLPGALGQLYDAATQKIIKYGVLKPAEYMGLFPQGKVDEFIASMNRVASAGEEPAGCGG